VLAHDRKGLGRQFFLPFLVGTFDFGSGRAGDGLLLALAIA